MAEPSWAMKGELVLSCNCTVFCPCVLSLGSHPPTEGYCQTWAGFRVDAGHFGEVDLSGELSRGVFRALRDPTYFHSFTLSGHTLSWANGADFAPEFLHRLMLSQREAVGHL